MGLERELGLDGGWWPQQNGGRGPLIPEVTFLTSLGDRGLFSVVSREESEGVYPLLLHWKVTWRWCDQTGVGMGLVFGDIAMQ